MTRRDDTAQTTHPRASSISLSNIRIRYGATLAVDDVDLDVTPGDILALVGPSGCGKTSLLKAIAGLEPLDGGAVSVDGERIDHLPPHRRQVGMVFQNYALFPHMRVAENVAFGLRLARTRDGHQEQGDQVDEALRLLRIGHLADAWPDQLSGGQQQRVALARTLVLRPRVLLLDEPLSALDRQLRDAMRSEIRQLVKEVGTTTVLVTHDQDEALSMADHIAIMRGGRIEQAGTPRELFDAPQTEFVGRFLGRSNALQASCAGVAGRHIQARVGDARIRAVWQDRQAAPAEGSAVCLLIRPDGLELQDELASSSELTAQVIDQLYMGDKVELRLQLADGQTLRTEVAANTPVRASGAIVGLRVHPHRVFAFNASTEG